MGDIYNNGDYLKHNITWHEEDALWKSQQVVKMLQKHKLDLNQFCEVGCGSGEIINQLSLVYSDSMFHGYDISQHAIKRCKPKEKKNLSFHHKDFTQENVTFDMILAIDVFEHVENHFEFLKDMKLKGKHKIFHIPLDLSVQSVLRNLMIINWKTVGHLHVFTKDTALACLKHAGYTIIDYAYTSPSIGLPNQSLKSKCLKLPRQCLFKLFPDLTVRFFGGYSLLVLAK